MATKRLDQNLSSYEPDNLINQTQPGTDVFSVELAAGLGILKRGSVLARSSTTGIMTLLGNAAVESETLTANCILCDTTYTGTAEGGPVPALAYRTGHFSRGQLIVSTGYTITDADEEELRKGGILLDDAV